MLALLAVAGISIFIAAQSAMGKSILGFISGAQREVLELKLLCEFTHSEAAAHLDIPLGTVKTRHRRGLKALRASLAGAVA